MTDSTSDTPPPDPPPQPPDQSPQPPYQNPQPPYQDPPGYGGEDGKQAYAQQPYSQQPYSQQPYSQQHYGQQPYGQQHYGQQWQPQGPYQAPPATNGLAIASLVLGILWLWWIGSILALVFGYIAK